MRKKHSVVAYIAFGSNVGDRTKNIKDAIRSLRVIAGVRVLRISRVIETRPVGGPPQGDYLNGVLAIATTLTPTRLLDKLQAIERKLGRVRTVRWGPRTIDLDILLFGTKKIKTSRLIVPHPRMLERDFVIGPLAQLLR